jgi:hypothetical protein
MPAPALQLSMFTQEPDDDALCLHGPELAASLPSDLDGLSDDELLTAATRARRLTSWAQERELAAIGELHRRRLQAEENGDPDYRILDAHESTCQEISAALAITPDGAANLVHLADRLDTDLPTTRQALQSGHIDKSKALVLNELTYGLDPELTERVEATVLPTADRRTTGQLRRRIRTLIKRLAPEHLRERKREAVQDRRLEVWDDDATGTSALTVTGLDPVRAHGTFNRITAAAQGIKADGDPRTLNQLRADLAQQLLHGHPLPEAIQHARTAGDQQDQASTHQGQGPGARSETGHGPVLGVAEAASDAIAVVIAEMADRELAFRITRAAYDIHDRLTGLREAWCRTHDPDHGRTVYRPSPTLRRAIEARHITCVFPTCNRRSDRCDADHTTPWGQGKSCRCNLAPLCRKHHRLKQSPGWRLIQPWAGLLIWIAPSGKWHITLPTRE